MAWTESYHCDVCNSPRGDAEDWWLAWTDSMVARQGEGEQPVLKVTPWSHTLSHAAAVKHLCGARCAQTFMDRWMHEADLR